MSDYSSGQPSKRGYSTFRDQHGRRWGAVTENKTRHPVGMPEPKFKAPILPPVHLIRPKPGDDSELVIDYKSWLGELDAAHQQWDQTLREAAKKLYGQGAIAHAIENPQPELLDEVGPRPKTDRREFVEAASQGNKWALGETTAVPAWAQAILEEEKRIGPSRAPEQKKYLDADEEVAAVTFPKNKGFGRWEFSDGSVATMTKDAALEKEAALLQEA